MKNNILLGIALITGLYVYFGIYKNELKKESDQQLAQSLTSLPTDEINAIEVVSRGKKSRYEKLNLRWIATEPIRDSLGPEEFTQWFEAVIKSKTNATVYKEGESFSPSQFGLEKSDLKITLLTETGRTEILTAGQVRAFEFLPIGNLKREKTLMIFEIAECGEVLMLWLRKSTFCLPK
jgi:hypothetical protein